MFPNSIGREQKATRRILHPPNVVGIRPQNRSKTIWSEFGRHFSIFYGQDDLAIRKPELELDICLREGRVEDEGFATSFELGENAMELTPLICSRQAFRSSFTTGLAVIHFCASDLNRFLVMLQVGQNTSAEAYT